VPSGPTVATAELLEETVKVSLLNVRVPAGVIANQLVLHRLTRIEGRIGVDDPQAGKGHRRHVDCDGGDSGSQRPVIRLQGEGRGAGEPIGGCEDRSPAAIDQADIAVERAANEESERVAVRVGRKLGQVDGNGLAFRCSDRASGSNRRPIGGKSKACINIDAILASITPS